MTKKEPAPGRAGGRRAKKEKPVVPQEPINESSLYTPLETAIHLRIVQRTLETIVKAKKLTPTWVGKGKRMFLGSEILRYIRDQTGHTAPAA